jgi:hypothetical protein
MLKLIGQHFPAACETLVALLSHPDARVRFTAIAWSQPSFSAVRLPRPFLVEFYRKALKDRSSKNRHFAYQNIYYGYVPEVLPEAKAALAVETDKKALDDFGEKLVPNLEKGFTIVDNVYSRRFDDLLLCVLLDDGSWWEEHVSKKMPWEQIKARAEQVRAGPGRRR